MPFASVTQLSDDDAEAAPDCVGSDADGPSAPPRKRCRQTGQTEPLKRASRTTMDEMVAKLAQPCSCKKITCLQQFKSEPMFSRFKAYFTEWMSLSKLDKDNVVCLALFSLICDRVEA